jgi:hypothetical protein
MNAGTAVESEQRKEARAAIAIRAVQRYFLFNSSSAQNFVPETSAEAINPLSLMV